MKKASFKKKLLYWFDNRISGGSMGLIRLLAVLSLFIVLLIALVIFLFHLNGEDGFLAAFWDSAATVINAWMPSFEDGGIGYLILMSLSAIAGLFITSVLIGICGERGIRINPPENTVIGEGERILVFAEEDDTAKFVEAAEVRDFTLDPGHRAEKRQEKVTVIGGLESLGTILYELPENVAEGDCLIVLAES